MLLERRGIGLSHARLADDRALADEEIVLYLAHSRVTEQRAAEQVGRMLDCLGEDPELSRGLTIVADDEVDHLAYRHEELIRFRDAGHAGFVRATLERYALAEVAVNREVSLAFVRSIRGILGWPAWKRALLAFGAQAAWAADRLWRWRRMVRLAQPTGPDPLGGEGRPASLAAEPATSASF